MLPMEYFGTEHGWTPTEAFVDSEATELVLYLVLL